MYCLSLVVTPISSVTRLFTVGRVLLINSDDDRYKIFQTDKPQFVTLFILIWTTKVAQTS